MCNSMVHMFPGEQTQTCQSNILSLVESFTYLALDISKNHVGESIDTHTLLHLCPALARHLVACRAAAGCGLPSRHQRGALSPQGSQQAQLRRGWSLPPGTEKVCRLPLIPFHTLGALASKSFLDNLSLTNRYKLARSPRYHLCMLHFASALCHNKALQPT